MVGAHAEPDALAEKMTDADLICLDGDDVIWTQQFINPTVYLDTCAIREISESTELTARFADAIKRKNGTWLLAPLSLGEFAVFKDPRHCAQAEIMLAQVVPNIYLSPAKFAANHRAGQGNKAVPFSPGLYQ